MIPSANRLSSLLILSVGLSVCGGCAEKGKRDGRFDDDKVVAVVGSTEITYGQIKFNYSDVPELRMAQEREASENPENFRHMCWFQERQSLQRRVFRALRDSAVGHYGIVASDEEVRSRAETMRAKQLSQIPDMDARIEKAAAEFRLMHAWLDNRERGEALYRQEFADEISRTRWASLKGRLELGFVPPKLTAEELKQRHRRGYLVAARSVCEAERLITKLVELGELEEGQNTNTWCWRQLSTVEFPVEELKISPDEKQTFNRWEAKPRPPMHEGVAVERPTSADGEE